MHMGNADVNPLSEAMAQLPTQLSVEHVCLATCRQRLFFHALQVATAVANAAYDTDNSKLKEKPKDMLAYIKSKMWVPGKTEIDNEMHDSITNHQIDQDMKEARQP